MKLDITCRCGRRLLRKRGVYEANRDAYACGCGVAFYATLPDAEVCQVQLGRDRACTEPAAVSTPVSLCNDHLSELLTQPAALRSPRVEKAMSQVAELADKTTRGIAEGRRRRKEERRAELDENAVVYYIRRDTRIKIGFTGNLEQRMLDLQPDAILAVEPGGRALEQAMHKKFVAAKIRGEWFSPTAELMSHIDTIRARQQRDAQQDHIGIADAAAITQVPAATIRRWLAEERLVRHGDHKPYRVSVTEVLDLRALMSNPTVRVAELPVRTARH